MKLAAVKTALDVQLAFSAEESENRLSASIVDLMR